MYLQNLRRHQQVDRTHSAHPLFISPDLRGRYTKRRRKSFLAHSQHLAAQPNTMTDECVNGVGLADHFFDSAHEWLAAYLQGCLKSKTDATRSFA
jgi:hypothetical protein